MDLKSFLLTVYIFINKNISLMSAGTLNNLVDVKGNNAIKEIRILYQEPNPGNIPIVYQLFRGFPLFAEIDFLPRYIPQFTYYVGVSVTLPENIRGKQWVLGYHQEVFQIPQCRLCTNTNQWYTMPVTLFLSDDGWCSEEQVPTLWKVEAIPMNRREHDLTDMTIGLVYDKDKQIKISNSNTTRSCNNRHEMIRHDYY